MAKDKSLYMRIDTLTELLIAQMMQEQNLTKSEVVRKAIYNYAVANMEEEEFASLVQLATDCERL